MARANETKINYLRERIAAQRRWIEDHGGDRAGYYARYGAGDFETYGAGGDSIYAADKAQLDELVQRLAKITDVFVVQQAGRRAEALALMSGPQPIGEFAGDPLEELL